MKDWKAAARNWMRRAGIYGGADYGGTKTARQTTAREALEEAAQELENGNFVFLEGVTL